MNESLTYITKGYLIGGAASVVASYFLKGWEGVGVVAGLHIVVLAVAYCFIYEEEEDD